MSPNWKPPLADWGSQPETRHSCLNVQCPAVPGVGPAKHVKRMPFSPKVAGKDPPQTSPWRSAVSFWISAGGGCALTESVADCVPPLAEAAMTDEKASPL